MTDRVVVPVGDQKGLDACLAQHFGRAPYYAIVDLDENGNVSNVKTVPNTGEHFGGTADAHSQLLELKPNAIVAYGMGPRGLNSFQSAGISVLQATANTVAEVVNAYKEDKLPDLTKGCEHAHHHH